MFGIGLLFRGEQTLGLGNVYVPKKKYEGGGGGNLWAQIGSAALSLGSTLFGLKKSADANNEAKRIYNQSHNSNMAYYKRLYNQKYADTAAGQNFMRQINNAADKNWKKAQGAAAVGGGTDAANALEKQRWDNVYGNAAGTMAATDTSTQKHAADSMAKEVTNHANISAAQMAAEGANIAKAASDAGNAIASGVSAIGSSKSTGDAGSSSNQTANSAGINTNQQYNIKLDDVWKRKEGNNNLPGVWNRSV